MASNERDDVCYAQPRTLDQRALIARDFVKRNKFTIPMVVDRMTNDADRLFGAWPERLYIIDSNGKIAFKGGMGPFEFDPEAVHTWLEVNISK